MQKILDKEFESEEHRSKFIHIYSLSVLCNNCILSDSYIPSSVFKNAIELTPEGLILFDMLKRTIEDIQESEIIFSIFMQFGNSKPFIDIFKTKSEQIIAELKNAIINGDIRFPWIYGRELYNKYNNLMQDNKENDELLYNETFDLLNGTAQGVFQKGDIITGPLGLIKSSCYRNLHPTKRIPLWHCPDIACRSIHEVNLRSAENKITEADLSIDLQFNSEWEELFEKFISDPDYHDDTQIRDLPYLIANSFSKMEIKNILKQLLDNAEIREFLPKDKKYKSIFSKPSEHIVSKLSEQECFQLILIADENTIISNIEDLIDKDVIKIPSTEIRDSHTPLGLIRGSMFKIKSECSKFGIRTKSIRADISLSRLKRLINYLYDNQTEADELEWKLKTTYGDTLDDKLDNYLHTADPRRIVEQLLLDSLEHSRKTSEIVKLRLINSTTTAHEINKFINKILWKLSFSIPAYPEYSQIFWDRLTIFSTAVRAGVYAEEDKSNIRSQSVNLFISLEEILGYSLSFCTWVLLSDHCAESLFEYNPSTAQEYMAKIFNESKINKNSQNLIFNPEGKNTLYPLIQGFMILSKILEFINSDNPKSYKKLENDFPGYFNKTDLLEFPFVHKCLFLDLRNDDKAFLINSLKDITKQFTSNDISNLRNKLEHHRKDDFPDQVSIESAIQVITNVINDIEESGIYPLVWLQTNTSTDQFARETITFENYKGKKIYLRSPSKIHIPSQVSMNDPLIIVPRMRIRNSSQQVYFKFTEDSDYNNIWHEYPREY